MLAVDTNVVVRYLRNDEPLQAAKARKLIETSDVFLSTTVLLEVEWVLRYFYDYSPSDCAAALADLVGLPHVTVESPTAVAKALAWTSSGLDFPDALHLAKAEGCDEFITFDQKFAKAANALGGMKVRAP
jgi:predicted nucleic-acid-binding protein